MVQSGQTTVEKMKEGLACLVVREAAERYIADQHPLPGKSPVSKSILDMPSLFPTLGSSRKGRFADLDSDKLRGGYYTSPEVASWLCSWAIRSVKETVLEPSCGNGVFLTAAARRYEELGARPQGTVKRLTGVEF